MDNMSGWQREEELLFFPIPLERISFICNQSYQNGFSLKLKTAIQTIISDVLLTTKARSALLS